MAGSLIPPPPDAEIPPPPDAGGTSQPDLIGQIKSRIIKERAPGEMTRFGESDLPGRIVRGMVPGSWPGLIAAGASLIPGVGVLPALGRTAVAGGTAAGVEALRGGDPGKGALEAAGGTLAGEAAGGLARAGSRYLQSKFDPLAQNLAAVIEKVVPVFKGATPRSTLVKAMGTEGQVALSRQYGDAVETAIKEAGNPYFGGLQVNPTVAAALERAGKPVPQSPVPGYEGPADKVWAQIKSEKNRLMTQAREPSKVQDVYARLDAVHESEDAFAKAIEAKLGPEARGVFAKANADYRAGKELQRLFSPSGRMNAAKVEKIIKPGEGLSVDQPRLASNLALRAGRLQEALGPEGFAALQQAIQRGSETGARDIPGKVPYTRFHLGFLPSVHGLPHAPQLVGAPEQRSAILADVIRRLGIRGAGTAMENQ